jgi:hypothetical protein
MTAFPRASLLVLTLSLAAAVAPAQAQPAPAPEPDPLAGPKVAERPRDARSLVEHDPMGKLVRLERDAALEALDRLELDDATRAKVDQIVTARLAVLDTIVQDNILLLASLNNARMSGDRAEGRKALAQLMGVARPYLARGTLVEELRPALSADQHAELKRMVDEYHAAAVEARIGEPGDDGRPANRAQAEITERLNQLGVEVRRSYERRVASGGQELDDFLAKLDLTPEQEGRIRKRIEDAYIGAAGKPSRAQIAKVFLESWQDLTTAQRQKLMQVMREQRQYERTPAPPPPPTPRPAPKDANP